MGWRGSEEGETSGKSSGIGGFGLLRPPNSDIGASFFYHLSLYYHKRRISYGRAERSLYCHTLRWVNPRFSGRCLSRRRPRPTGDLFARHPWFNEKLRYRYPPSRTRLARADPSFFW